MHPGSSDTALKESARALADVDVDLTRPPGDAVAGAEPGGLRRLTRVGVAVLCILNVADVVTTRVILGHAGLLEANPLASALLAYYRVDVVKALLLLALAWVALRHRPTLTWACCVWFACGYYTLAVISNGLLIASLP